MPGILISTEYLTTMTAKVRSLLFTAIFIIVVLFSCKPDPLKVDVSDIDVSLSVTRLEKFMFGVNEEEFAKNIETIKRDHLSFFDIYSSYVLNIGTMESPDFNQGLRMFVTDSVFSRVGDSVLLAFKSIDKLEKELTEGFRHFKYYFPNARIPNVYTCVSGFTKSVFISDYGVGIGLDKYFGSDCVFYSYLGVPVYKRYNMNPGKIVPDVFYSMYLSDFVFSDSINNLLANMVYQGKGLYFTKAMCPETPDTLIMGYSSKQLKWCHENEGKMWTYLVERKLLYDNERLTLQKYIGDSPFTTTFSSESPGRTGNWLGYRIVESFMKNNPDITLNQLLAMNNSQQILAMSKYFPD